MAPISEYHRTSRRAVSAFLLILGFIPIAHSQPLTVTSEADFLALTTKVAREGFEGFPTLSCTDANGVPGIQTSEFDVITIPQAGGTSWVCVGGGVNPGPTEGNNALIAGSATGDPFNLEFSFGREISAIYFELTDAVERGDAYFFAEGTGQYLVASRGSGGLNTVRFGIVGLEPVKQFTLINTGLFDGWGVDNLVFVFASLSVSIDIKPESKPNSVNLASGQKIPVAILTTEDFDATQVDWETVSFGPGGAAEFHGRAHIEDVDLDGDMDLLLHFDTEATGITCGETEATLTGKTFNGEAIFGTDSVFIVNCD